MAETGQQDFSQDNMYIAHHPWVGRSILPFVTYDGPAHGRLVILTNKKRVKGVRQAREVPVATIYVRRRQVLEVSDLDLEILKDQNQIGKGRLEETSAPSPDKFMPILKSKE